ncbi:MAG: arginase family protein [Eubacteriales bacterium]|nr:arginase family protein [Eubacteriales bacterium]
MLKEKAIKIVVMDFSGIYRREQFGRYEVFWVEAKEIPGTNCYCDQEAMELLRSKIAEFPAKGIHFLDSGNYHYMSRLWLEKIREPFRLLVLDNHTDMQLPAFGGLLSCGGWIAAALDELENLQEVILAGPDREAFSRTEAEYQGKVRFLSREELKEQGAEGVRAFISALPVDLPLYISVDKDVLCPGEADTAWSQGDMTLSELLDFLDKVAQRFASGGGRILGVDICGESSVDGNTESRVNEKANRELLDFFAGK